MKLNLKMLKVKGNLKSLNLDIITAHAEFLEEFWDIIWVVPLPSAKSRFIGISY